MALFLETTPEVQLRGPRLLLLPPRRADYRDWSSLRAISRDFLVPWEPTWTDDALTRTAYRRRLRRVGIDWREDSGYSFHIFERQQRCLVGGISLNNVRRGVAMSGSVGYWIGAPYAHRGYMTEALVLLIEYAFEEMGLHRIEAACLPSNIPSQNLLKKVGFQPEGLARKYLRINGLWEDHLLFALLREDPPTDRDRALPPQFKFVRF